MARAATPEDAEKALELIAQGDTQHACAVKLGCHYPSLTELLKTDEYSARAKDARLLGAEARIDAARDALLAIPDDAPRALIARQIALEQHERKRASFLNPSRYSDKISAEVTGTVGVTVTMSKEEADL